MPIYEYSCKKCGKTIEALQKFDAAPLRKHQGCGGTLTKLISASGFQFKGTGWYVTDYSKKSSGGKDAAEPAAKTDSGSKESTPAPAAKASTDTSKKSGDS